MIVDVTSASTNLSVWKQDRLVFRYSGETAGSSVGVWTNLHGNYGTPMARYTVPASQVLLIDMTDYVRAYASTLTKITVYGSVGHEYNITIVGLISPDSVLIPPGWGYAKIAPPDYMIAPGAGQSVIAELFGTPGYGYSANPSPAAIVNNGRGVSCSEAFTLTRTGDSRSKQYKMRAQQCGLNYALVEWVSFTGAQRRHIFEVIKTKTSAADAYSLRNINNEYTEIKGREDALTLRLLGLNMYDFWYYSDVITSSNVQVSFDGTNYTRVQVTSKSVTIPDGENTDGKLEINVNWKRYDAVAM